jgi:dUTP pyrophosphatase
MNLLIKKLYNDAISPTYSNEYAAGLDLYAYGEYIIPSKTKVIISTGICVKWSGVDDTNYYMRIAPLSGLSLKKFDLGTYYYIKSVPNTNLYVNTIHNSTSIINYDYRGEIKIYFINNSDTEYNIKHGDKVAQAILEKIIRFNNIIEELNTIQCNNNNKFDSI